MKPFIYWLKTDFVPGLFIFIAIETCIGLFAYGMTLYIRLAGG